MQIRDLSALDPTQTYWVPAVVAPARDWAGISGSHKGSRFMVHRESMELTRDDFKTFSSQSNCLQWIMRHRVELNQKFPGAPVRAVALDQWLLGLD